MAILKDGLGTTNQAGVDSHGRLYTGLYDSSGNAITSSNPMPVAASPPSDTFVTAGTITATDTGTTQTLGFNNQPIVTGTPTAGSFVQMALSSVETVHVQALGTFTAGNLVSEFSFDGGTTFYRETLRISGTSTASSTPTGVFGGIGVAAGKGFWRLRATGSFAGSLTVKVSTSNNQGGVYVLNALQLSDGVASVLATIKAASTASLATDNALVVAHSPNSPTPAGANQIGSVAQAGVWAVTAALSTGSNTIGAVTQAGTWAVTASLAAGSNVVGAVTQSGTWTVSVSNFPTTQAISGTVAVNNFPATQAVSGSVSVSNLPTTQTVSGSVSVSNLPTTQTVQNANSTTAALTSIAASASSTSILAANTARKGVILANDSTSIVYIAYGATATTSAYTFAMAAKSTVASYWEMPDNTIFTGAISAIWASATGALRVTELS